ncbi:MAG: ATP-dependent zinc metalloprotease FtsH [Planctomycetaceae bacterium]|jgi:cell division protease FtsH|nr:ATP-dependent zinc metalloprotease FtsH [Planctomycetaceae bacterium]
MPSKNYNDESEPKPDGSPETENNIPETENNLFEIENKTSETENNLFEIENKTPETENNLFEIENKTSETENNLFEIENDFPKTKKRLSKTKSKKKQLADTSQNQSSDQSETDKDSKDSAGNSSSGSAKPRKTAPQEGGTPSILLILALILGTVLILTLFQTGNHEIPYNRMMELIDLGPETPENLDPHIIIEEGDGLSATTVRYSKLDHVVVNPYEIRGRVTRQVLKTAKKPEPQKSVHNVAIFCGRSGFADDSAQLQERLEKSKFTYRSEGYNFLRENGIYLLFFLVTIGIMIFVLRGITGSGAMAFGRNRGRLVAQEEIDITFNDVAGVDEAVDELKEIVDFLKTPEKFQALGGRIPRGVLLVGPPGTGKTILAKAVAGEANVPFYSLSGSDFVELYVGVGAARVRDLFDQAQRKNPSIIFIDELDALGKVRGNSPMGSHDERDQTLNALLVEMDGFSTNSGVIVMGATNRPEILDPALLRPGRFDRQVLVDRPDLHGREAILKVHVKNVKLAPNIDLKEIASITSGFVGADLAALVNEAALLAARAGKNCVTMTEFNEGVERVTTGLQKKQRVIRPDEKKRIAVHECGHALVAYFTPNSDPVHKVSIIPRGLAALGYTLQRPEDDRYLMTQKELEARIQTFLAGTIAEEMEFDAVSTGAQNDLERATDIARAMVMDFGMSRLGRITFRDNPRANFLGDGFPAARQHSEKTAWEIDQEIRSIIDALFEKTRVLLQDKRNILERLTERLLEKEIIENDELKEVIESA